MATESNPRPRHEQRDTKTGWVFGLVLTLGLCVLAVQFVVGRMMGHLGRLPAASDAWASAVRPGSGLTQQLTYPRLQVAPQLDLETFRAREEKEMNQYGWENATSGIVRIPVSRAMELLVERGLPEGTNRGGIGPSSYQLEIQRAGPNGSPGRTNR